MENTELLLSKNVIEKEVLALYKASWNIQSIQHHTKYLGLPSFVGHSRSTILWIFNQEFGTNYKDGRRNSDPIISWS